VYPVAIIDWKTRAVLAWRVSNTMDVDINTDHKAANSQESNGSAPWRAWERK
jgi:transposase InsO family protein